MLMSANPKANYESHKKILKKTILDTLESGLYILGPRVDNFEKHFASYIGTNYSVGVANGTDAISLSLRAIGVVQGDYVVTVSQTAVATVAAIDWIGAHPILVDIDPMTYTMDANKLEDTLKKSDIKRIKAVVVVGHPAAIQDIRTVTERYGLSLIEDCAQAHGAMVNNIKVGGFGICGAFSFYPTKNLGAMGDAGAIVTNNPDIMKKVKRLQQYGWNERYISDEYGYNSRLDELQAAILDCKIAWLDSCNKLRRKIAGIYQKNLFNLPIILPKEMNGFYHVYHQYAIRCSYQKDLQKFLRNNDVSASILYPVPVHLQPGYRNRVIIGNGGLNNSEQIVNEILCLPIYPELKIVKVKKIINLIQEFYKNK